MKRVDLKLENHFQNHKKCYFQSYNCDFGVPQHLISLEISWGGLYVRIWTWKINYKPYTTTLVVISGGKLGKFNFEYFHIKSNFILRVQPIELEFSLAEQRCRAEADLFFCLFRFLIQALFLIFFQVLRVNWRIFQFLW